MNGGLPIGDRNRLGARPNPVSRAVSTRQKRET
jgi:hypothetical protein